MNDLQKRFEEEQRTEILNIRTCYESKETADQLILGMFVMWLKNQLTWRSVEKLPEYELDIDGICNELAIVKYNCGDDDNYAVATYEWINQNFVEVEYWLPIPKLD